MIEEERRDANRQIGARLKEFRKSIDIDKSEIAQRLNVSDEHYRKIESGATGLSAEKMLILHDKYDIDLTYLVTGTYNNAIDFNLDYYIANSSKEQRDDFIERMLAYLEEMMKS